MSSSSFPYPTISPLYVLWYVSSHTFTETYPGHFHSAIKLNKRHIIIILEFSVDLNKSINRG